MTRALVLLSAGLHPASGRPAPVPVELQAIRLACALDPDATGLHAGPGDASIAECLGHGLSRILTTPGTGSLAAAITRLAPRLVLAGRRGQGGEDGGLLPYRLAHALGLPLLPDIVDATIGPDHTLHATQWRPLGARRATTLAGPAILTIHPAAPQAHPYVHAAARRGTIQPLDLAPDLAPDPEPGTPHPYRHRPPVTGTAAPATNRIVTDATPDEAARLILAHLHAIGTLARNSLPTGKT